nr:hypothetical protein Iba_chr07cCG0890 [Ipomoea batatas]
MSMSRKTRQNRVTCHYFPGLRSSYRNCIQSTLDWHVRISLLKGIQYIDATKYRPRLLLNS